MQAARRRAPSAPDGLSDAQELCLWLVGTATRREAKRERIRELAERVDYDLLAEALFNRRMLALLGERLLEAANGAAPARFHEYVARSARHAGRRATLFAGATQRLLGSLEEQGVATLALKGPLLAERIHGDSSKRGSVDIDLLVRPRDFGRAVAILRAEGYGPLSGSPWYDGLPLFEGTLPPERPWLPKVDLHWRIHWYESDFSAQLLERSVCGADDMRVPCAADELAAMLLYYARDAFWGLRLPADIAAWWDTYGETLEDRALDEVVCAHPKLRRAILSSAVVAQRVSGLPAERVLSLPASTNGGGRRAVSLANWHGSGIGSELHSSLVVLDWLLTPPGDRKSFVARHFFPPPSAITSIYSIPDDARIRRVLRRAYYGFRVGARLLPWALSIAWHTRRGRDRFPLPG